MRGERNLHLWSGLILLGVFLAGAAAGAGVHAWARPSPAHLGVRHGGPKSLLRELELSPEQHEQARGVFDRHRAQVEAVMREGFPKIRAAQDALDAELRTILTPEQRNRLDELRARRRPFMGPGGPPPEADGFGPPPPPPPP